MNYKKWLLDNVCFKKMQLNFDQSGMKTKHGKVRKDTNEI